MRPKPKTPKPLKIKTPEWFVPYLSPKRFKGLYGGRAAGKSHAFAELAVETMLLNPDTCIVCIREVQRSLKFSAKKLIEDKIRLFGVDNLFEVTLGEIRSKIGDGLILFQGMQDHTAESIKSLEGFDIAWVEEAHCISKLSMELLTPTILRKDGAEVWFSWNRSLPTDPVEQLFEDNADAIVTHVNYTDNPHCPDAAIEEAERCKRKDPQSFRHIWLGDFNYRSEAQVFHNKFRVGSLDVTNYDPLYGIDFGFAQDPTVAVEVYLIENTLYVSKECGKVGLELDATAAYIDQFIPLLKKHVVRADSARPESISYLMRHGIPKIMAVKKGKGSIEDGVELIRSMDDIVIAPGCVGTLSEFQLYSHKRHRKTGDILPEIEDKNNHFIDAIRYAIEPVIRYRSSMAAW